MRPLLFLLAAAALAAFPVAALGAGPVEVHFPHNRPEGVSSPAVPEQVDTAELAKLVARVRAKDSLRYYCEGHTSRPGTVGYNKELARRRCQFVVARLSAAGVEGRAVVPRAADLRAGCHLSGGTAVCGEAHASEDDAASRKVVVRFVREWAPESCESFRCAAGTVRLGGRSEQCSSADDCQARCCAFDSERGCDGVTCAAGRVKASASVPCDSPADCEAKCCEGHTCESFWRENDQACPAGYEAAADRAGDACDGTAAECAPKCCAPATCGAFFAASQCPHNHLRAFGLPPGTRCEEGGGGCVRACCTYSGPSIGVDRQATRDCMREIPCYHECVMNKCSPFPMAVSKGKAVCRDTCAVACGQRTIRACTGDYTLSHIKPDTCRSMCR